jgi:hypothetical protein
MLWHPTLIADETFLSNKILKAPENTKKWEASYMSSKVAMDNFHMNRKHNSFFFFDSIKNNSYF